MSFTADSQPIGFFGTAGDVIYSLGFVTANNKCQNSNDKLAPGWIVLIVLGSVAVIAALVFVYYLTHKPALN